MLYHVILDFEPALGVSVKSIHLVAGRLGLYSQSGHTKDYKNSIRSFRARRSAQAEVRRVLCMCCSSCMSLNSVQSFVIENCNGPTNENGLNNVCLHPLSRTFTFILDFKAFLWSPFTRSWARRVVTSLQIVC